ncbi:hypothetical protein EDB80DRAFT_704710 [Ilyonectria destructans]|nr:hypothetical protein EDB80DRAFT_704710 [Ilyonectria destructans]
MPHCGRTTTFHIRIPLCCPGLVCTTSVPAGRAGERPETRDRARGATRNRTRQGLGQDATFATDELLDRCGQGVGGGDRRGRVEGLEALVGVT